MRRLFLALCLLCGRGALAQEEPTREDLLKAYEPALVEIRVLRAGKPAGSGLGFFISERGEAVASYRLLAQALAQEGGALAFRASDGTPLSRYKIADCGDKRGLDLCLLKFARRPKAWLGKAERAPFKAQRAFALARAGAGYGLFGGLVEDLRSQGGIERLSTSIPLSARDAGAPILGEAGQLLGMAGTGLRASEISAYVGRSRDYREPAEFRRVLRERRRKEADELEARFVSEARRLMEAGSSLSPLLKAKLEIRTPAASYRGLLPDLGWKCADAPGGFFSVLCSRADPVLGTVARFGVRVSPWKGKMDLTQKGVKEGAQCGLCFEGAFKGRPSCSRLTDGDEFSLSFQDKDVLFDFYAWSKYPESVSFYYKIPELFVDTLVMTSAPGKGEGKAVFDENWLKLKP